MKLFGNFLRVFAIRPTERLFAISAFVFILILNAVMVIGNADTYMFANQLTYKQIVGLFHVSGFDAITYAVIHDWDAWYNIYRHPLLAFFMYPFYLINLMLTAVTGVNCFTPIVGLIMTVAGFYAALFTRRVLGEVVGLSNTDANLLTGLFFSFAYIMLSVMVPDHFGISLMLLMLTLWLSGMAIKQGKGWGNLQTVVLFMLVGGVSLNNGLKVFLSSLMVNGKRFFRPVHLLLCVIVPACAIWWFARWEYRTYQLPREKARTALRAKQKAAMPKRNTRQTAVKRIRRTPVTGKPLMHGEFMRWTDITTPRLPSLYHNVFGEGIILHKQYLLQDEFAGRRPMFVAYESWVPRVAQIAVLLLFGLGVVVGIRQRFFVLTMLYALFDLILHIGLGFGINEVYIMSAHWMYVVPIGMAYLLKSSPRWALWPLRSIVALLVVYIGIRNIVLIVGYLLG